MNSTLTITDVQKQKKKTARRSIFINGEFSFGVGEETYVKFALFKGREIDNDFIDEVKAWDELYHAKQTAMNFVNSRRRSEREVAQKLRDRGYSIEAIEETQKFLKEYEMLDDLAFARAWINDRLLKRATGQMKLRMELMNKGVDKETITEALNDIFNDEFELQQAMEAAEKKAGKIRKEDPRKWEQSMSSFLVGRGFGWDVIRKVLEKYREERT
ncbi:MAG: RecX family transcriptional regulator [Candidatus Kapaibacterium sp.]